MNQNPILLYNSLSRKKEAFTPLKAPEVRMYICGPTVYDEAHIGHARSAYIFDVIRRYFSYKGYRVKCVRNVTDVDDKIIDKARREFEGEDLNAAVTKVSLKYLASYHDDMERLGILPPDAEPKATEYIDKMLSFIRVLIERGVAYASGGDVYFDIRKAKEYGKLSGQSLEKMEVGARIAPGQMKRDGLDFALWKAAKEGEPSWPSPWGAGRPGWHIECSVMSSDILGDEFDIHAGGIDLIFPHHENEIAQSEGAGKPFARYWLHNGLLTIDNEKMAKSLGNFITIKDFIAKYGDADYLKLFFLSGLYRSPLDFTAEKIEAMKKEKERISIFIASATRSLEKFEALYGGRVPKDGPEDPRGTLRSHAGLFEKAMDDDFNTPQALAEIFNMVHHANTLAMSFSGEKADAGIYAELRYARDAVLGYLHEIFGLFLSLREDTLSPEEKDTMAKRNAARVEKNFAAADEMRIKLLQRNIILEDTKDGTVWRRKF